MPTTTNYGWTTPADTDLVKDGASAIRTLGSSIDTTTKALNPSTTLGDIEYRSSTANTNTRLAIGTTGQVLTVSGGVPAWATSSSGGMTLISTTSMSGSSSIALSSIPSTYNNLQLLIVGPTTATGGNWRLYTTPSSGLIYGIGTVTSGNQNQSGLTSIGETTIYGQSSTRTGCAINILDYASTNRKFYSSFGMNSTTQNQAFGEFGCIDASAAITSLTITNNNAVNFTGGTIYLYGVK